jgi:hypothetical protein
MADEDRKILISTSPEDGGGIDGSILMACKGEGCERMVWLSPASQAMIAKVPEMEPMCLECGMRTVDEGDSEFGGFIPGQEGEFRDWKRKG